MYGEQNEEGASPPDRKIQDELVFLRGEVKRLRQALNRFTPGLEILLRRRGFKIYRKFSGDVLLPAQAHRDEFYRILHKYSFRLFLRDAIKNREFLTLDALTRYAAREVTAEYLEYMIKIGLVEKRSSGYALTEPRVVSFGPTLEWYIAEILIREFGAEAIWGVKFKRPDGGGDYDVIAVLDGALVYLEVKSSPPKQIYDREIRAFLDRVSEIGPEIAVYAMDTELRMKDKIVPMFEQELQLRFSGPPGVKRIERELFSIKNKIFIMNAKESLIRNLETVLRTYYTRSG